MPWGKKKRKICIVLTVRGNYAKMKSLIRKIQKAPDLELQNCAGGIILHQYGNPINLLQADGFKIHELIVVPHPTGSTPDAWHLTHSFVNKKTTEYLNASEKGLTS